MLTSYKCVDMYIYRHPTSESKMKVNYNLPQTIIADTQLYQFKTVKTFFMFSVCQLDQCYIHMLSSFFSQHTQFTCQKIYKKMGMATLSYRQLNVKHSNFMPAFPNFSFARQLLTSCLNISINKLFTKTIANA